MSSRAALLAFCLLTMCRTVSGQESSKWLWSPGLGFYYSTITPPLAMDLGLNVDGKYLILATVRGGPVDAAGLKPGDVIVSLTGAQEALTEDGKDVRFQFLRDGLRHDADLRSGSAAARDDRSPDLVWPDHQPRPPATYTIDSDGSGSFRTITAALHRATAGDTIILQPGQYGEAVLLPPGIVIRASDRKLVEIVAPREWYMTSPGKVSIEGIMFTGHGLRIRNADAVEVTDDRFVLANGVGLDLLDSKNVMITHSSFVGASDVGDIMAVRSYLVVKDDVFSNAKGYAVAVADHSRLELADTVIDGYGGASAVDSIIVARRNMITGGWTPADKGGPPAGIQCKACVATLSHNAIRRHRVGVLIETASELALIADNTVTQCMYGIGVVSSPVMMSGNLVIQNGGDGVDVMTAVNDTKPASLEVTISRNTISQNGGAGINIRKINGARLVENLVEANGNGIGIVDSETSIENNTVVLQRYDGMNIGGHSDAQVYNNIVAYNAFGVVADVDSHCERGYNDVYGNLANVEFPLVDGNYRRRDRYTTRDGRKVVIEVYPAYDIAAPADVSIDPGFVKLGSDYTLNQGAPLAAMRGRGGRNLGAYRTAATNTVTVSAPEDFRAGSAGRDDSPVAGLDSLNGRARERGDIQDAFFNYDDPGLSPESQAALTATAYWLKSNPDVNLLIEGHCDERGTEQYNLALGDRRANAARDFLTTLGIDAGRIRTVSYGEEQPFAEGHDEAAWARNRRVHLVLVK